MKPGLEDIIKAATRKLKMELNICMPCTIERFYSENKTCDVQPDIDVSFFGDVALTSKVLKRLPILYPFTTEGGLYFPLKQGDRGLIIVAQRDLDNWKSNGPRIPRNSMAFQLSSGFVIPSPTHADMIGALENVPEGVSHFGKKHFRGDADPEIATLQAQSSLANQNIDLFALFDEALIHMIATATAAGNAAGATALQNIKTDLGKIMAQSPTPLP